MLTLEDGSEVAVIGGGPAGSFFTYFLLEMAQRVDINLQVDLYEFRDFNNLGPRGCNMCGGIISESLVQNLAIEGINLPSTVVKRGIDSYILHMDVGSTRIETPFREKKIAAVHRGGGPLGIKDSPWRSFDGYLSELAISKGAHFIQDRVSNLGFNGDRPEVTTRSGLVKNYDFLVGAVGINSPTLELFQKLGFHYTAPKSTKTYISEFNLGKERVEKFLGSSMHVFLLNIPRLEFAAIIPKGDYATLCLMGEEIDSDLITTFLNTKEVRECFPDDVEMPQPSCHCFPKIFVQETARPFTDRILLLGDCGVTRLYKDGIGAAYKNAKTAAVTAIFEGVSEKNFLRFYWPTCKKMSIDNKFAKVIFAVTTLIQKTRLARRGVLNMVIKEQLTAHAQKRMSMVLWDTFTGSASYKDVFIRTLKPLFLLNLLWHTLTALWPFRAFINRSSRR